MSSDAEDAYVFMNGEIDGWRRAVCLMLQDKREDLLHNEGQMGRNPAG